MGIVDEDVARVRDSTDLVALVGDYVGLRRVGQRFMGLCPFHEEKTPSFSINPSLGVFHCFGCNKSGDAITFLRELEHLDFVDAVERLAARAGITLRYDTQRAAQDRSRRSRLVEAVDAATRFYHSRLVDAPDGGTARKYLRGRGFDGDVARRFSLGWAPDAWDALSTHLQQAKFARDDIVGAGLAFVNKANRLQDQFRARLVFPIFDARGEPVGFGGRALGDEQPKYKNSPETSIYTKSRLLYGLNWAKGEIVARGEVVICEGYTDVMAFALAGAPHAVATCGTALADDHFQMLKNLARRVVLAYDDDAAGQGAAERWYRWEQAYELEVRVADLPAGRDPGDLWPGEPERLLEALARAAPFLQFRLDRAISAADTSTIESRARGAEVAARIIAEHPNDLVRDEYVMKLAGELGFDADRLRETVARAAAAPRAQPPRGSTRGPRAAPRADQPESSERAPELGAEPGHEPAVSVPAVDRRELDVLRWAVHAPELVADWLDESLFADPTARAAFACLASTASFAEALDAAEAPVRALLERIAVEEPSDPEPETLRARLLVRAVVPVAQQIAAALTAVDDARASELMAEIDRVTGAESAGDWDDAQNHARRLLGWSTDERSRPGVDA